MVGDNSAEENGCSGLAHPLIFGTELSAYYRLAIVIFLHGNRNGGDLLRTSPIRFKNLLRYPLVLARVFPRGTHAHAIGIGYV